MENNFSFSNTDTPSNAVPLSHLRYGQSGLVVALQGGGDFRSRMLSMGFSPGCEVAVQQNFGRGPMIVCVRETRVALGRGESEKIIVQLKNGPCH